MRLSHRTLSGIVIFTIFLFLATVVCCFGSKVGTDSTKGNSVVEEKMTINSTLQDKAAFGKGDVQSQIAQMSEKEKIWYLKFQNGIPFFDGWKDISQNIISNFPEEEKDRIKTSLKKLGNKIGIEWAKDNAIRKIDTDMLRGWGKKLEKAIDKGFKHVTETVHRVEREVDEILSSKLMSKKKEN